MKTSKETLDKKDCAILRDVFTGSTYVAFKVRNRQVWQVFSTFFDNAPPHTMTMGVMSASHLEVVTPTDLTCANTAEIESWCTSLMDGQHKSEGITELYTKQKRQLESVSIAVFKTDTGHACVVDRAAYLRTHINRHDLKQLTLW